MILLLALACTRDPEPVDLDALPWPNDATTLPSPMVADVPLLPWPSDQYLVEDAATRTGKRIQVSPELLPAGLPPRWLDGDDGFSRMAPIVTWLRDGLDPDSLPDANDPAATTLAGSPILLVDLETFERWPVLAELDATADADEAPLILRPQRVLRPATRYAVFLLDSLRELDGTGITHDPLTDRMLQADPDDAFDDDAAIAAWGVYRHFLLDALVNLDVDPTHVAQAWTFTTRSGEQVRETALATQDNVGFGALPSFTLEPPVYEESRAVIRGTAVVPNFLDETNRIQLDETGAAIQHGVSEAPIFITVPRTVTQTRPTVLFGHGFFSSYEETTWGNLSDGLARWQMPAVSTEFVGFSEQSLGQAISILLGNLDGLDTIIDQQLQSHANFTLLHRLIQDGIADAVVVDWGDGPFQPLSAENVPYMGISNGGTQGLVMMTTSPSLTRGLLVVPGGGWSHMLQRASQWNELGAGISARWEDARDLQLAMSMLQQVFDPVDSLNYVEHLVDDRLPNRAAEPEVLLIEAMQDAQVANIVTEWVAREAGVPIVAPSPYVPWALDTVEAPLPDGTTARAACSIYDLGLPPNPAGNVPPVENGAHGDVRSLDSYQQQVGIFLEQGVIVHPCDGPCDPL